jgi:hypothetical protein
MRTPFLVALVVALALALGTPRRAGAADAPSRVAVVRPASDDPLLREANTRLRAELTASGFEVTEVDRAPGDSRSEVEAESENTGSFATVFMDRSGGSAFADVWIGDRVTGKTVVRRLRVGAAPNAASLLAIRALELLKASLLEVAAAGPRTAEETPRREPPKDVMRFVEPSLPVREPPPSRFFEGAALGVGAFALDGLRGIGFALGPTILVSHGLSGPVFGRFLIAAPLVGSSFDEAEGTASLRQELFSLDVGVAHHVTRALDVFGHAGFGAYHLHVTGSAREPFRSTSDDVLSVLGAAGGGVALRVGRRIALTADASAIGLVPQPGVKIAGRRAGSAGAPSLGLSFGVLVGL